MIKCELKTDLNVKILYVTTVHEDEQCEIQCIALPMQNQVNSSLERGGRKAKN